MVAITVRPIHAGSCEIVGVGRIPVENLKRESFCRHAMVRFRVTGDHHHPLTKAHELFQRSHTERLQATKHDMALKVRARAP
jgi:hypothetical protein